MSTTKKIFITVGFILTVFIVGYLIYAVFFRSFVQPDQTFPDTADEAGTGLETSGTNTNFRTLPDGSGTLPGTNTNVGTGVNQSQTAPSTIARGGQTAVTTVTVNPSKFPTISSDGRSLLYFDELRGSFYSVDGRGNETSISDKKFFSVQNVVWSPDKKGAILEYPDGSNIYFNFLKDKQFTLPSHWEDFDFSPTGDEFVSKSLGVNAQNNYLVISDPEGKNIRSLANLSENPANVKTDWSPNNIMVGTISKGYDGNSERIFFIGKNNEKFQTTIVEGYGFESTWTPNGESLLYSVYSQNTDNKPELWVVDARPSTLGQGRKNLKLQTWSDKCAFESNRIIYCAVPSSLEAGAGMFREELDAASDILYKVDLNSGSRSIIAYPQNSPNIQDLIISDNGQYLYYRNSFDDKIYSLRLK